MNRRQPRFAAPESASVTDRYGHAAARYGTTSSAASGPGHSVTSMSRPARIQRPSARRTVARAPNAVAIEAMPPSRSGTMSCTAPNAWLAMPQQKNAASSASSCGVGTAPATASP